MVKVRVALLVQLKMRDMHLLICLLVFTVCRVQCTVFTSSPGNVSVLEYRPFILSWTHGLPDQDIEWCFYELESQKEFFGWDNKEKKQLNISENHVGWTFINRQSPCLGGITQYRAETHHTGKYRFVIIAQAVEHDNENCDVTVFSGSQLMYTLKINNNERKRSIAGQAQLETIEIASTGAKGNISITLEKDFPNSNITLRAHYRKTSQGTTLQSCLKSNSCSGEFDTESDLIQLSADFETGILGLDAVIIQGSEVVRVQQPVRVTGKSPGGKKWLALLMIPIIAMIGGVIFCIRKRKKGRYKKAPQGPQARRVHQKTIETCVQTNKPMLLNLVVEDNTQVEATWYHAESRCLSNKKYKTGNDNSMYYLMVQSMKKADGGDYTFGLNAMGSTQKAVYCFYVDVKDEVDLKFDMEPRHQYCEIGSAVSIKASVKDQDSVEFIWLKDGRTIPDDDIGTAYKNGTASTTLVIHHFSGKDAGKYHIFAQAGKLQTSCTCKLMTKGKTEETS